jgi:hypothetical protein
LCSESAAGFELGLTFTGATPDALLGGGGGAEYACDSFLLADVLFGFAW